MNFLLQGFQKLRYRRRSDQVELEIHTSRPGIIVGRSGTGIDKIKEDLQKTLKHSSQIRVNVTELKNMDADANIIGEFIAEQLEKRIPFRRATRQAIQKGTTGQCSRNKSPSFWTIKWCGNSTK